MSSNAAAFDRWIRSDFVALNTALEELYFAQTDRSNTLDIGNDLKAELRDAGHGHVLTVWQEGDTGDGFASAFNTLGNVGLYLGAMRRHELTNPDRESESPFPEASSLAQHIGATIGMAPRFATGHLTTHNLAVEGVRKSFTSLADEVLFIDENTRGIIGLQATADALARAAPLGLSSPIAAGPLADAARSLEEVIAANARLFDRLDPDRFFYCVRPYYKPYRVGRQVFRGANAGDFSGINELDLRLGLCRANDSYYSQLLVDKMPFMMPADQARLRATLPQSSLLDECLALLDAASPGADFLANARALLAIIDLFGAYAGQHHDQLVARFIAAPAADLGEGPLQGITASGPPLPVLLASLAVLRDYRQAVAGTTTPTRHADIGRLREALAPRH